MAAEAKDSSPLLTYEADEEAGRKAFETGLPPSSCPFPPGNGGNIRRLAFFRGYYAAKYWDKHKSRSGWDG